MAKEKKSKEGFEKGDRVTVTAGEHKGKTGEIEHVRAAVASATVRFDGSAREVNGVALSALVEAE